MTAVISLATRGRWHAGQTFLARELRAARNWANAVIPALCAQRDECLVIISELVTNAAIHAGVREVRVTLRHDLDRLSGEIVELGRSPLAPGPVTMRPYRGSRPGEELREHGHGLIIVGELCSEPLGITSTAEGRAIGFALEGCGCGAASGAGGRGPMIGSSDERRGREIVETAAATRTMRMF